MFKRLALAAFIFAAMAGSAFAQTACPPFAYKKELTPGEWQACFDAKQNAIGFTPFNQSGGTFLGEIKTMPSSTGGVGFTIQQGVAPTLPKDGNVWMINSGLYYRIGGVTIGPLGASFGSVDTSLVIASGVLGINYAHAGTWSQPQTFPNNSIALTKLPTQAANSILANATSGSASPVAIPISGCATSLTWVTNSGFGCTITNINATPQGRLTLTSGVPVLSATVTSATSVFYTPYVGNLIPLWNGTTFVNGACGEMTNVLANSATGNAGPSAAAASQVYDLYAWNNAGTCTLTRSPAWSAGTAGSNTARGTGAGGSARTRVQGFWTNTVAITNGPGAGAGTYVGTILTDAGGGTVSFSQGGSSAGGVQALINVYNAYNKVQITPYTADGTATTGYTGTVGVWRAYNNSLNNEIVIVRGDDDDGVSATFKGRVALLTNGFAWIGIGLDSSTAPATRSSVSQMSVNAAGSAQSLDGVAVFSGQPGLGVHTLIPIQQGDGTNANLFVGQNQQQSFTAVMRY